MSKIRINSFRKPVKSIDCERGTVLILTLVMLTIMSLLGVLSLNTSDSELKISSNYRSQLESFYSADTALEFAIASPNIYSALGGDTSMIYNLATIASDIEEGGATLLDGDVRFVASGALPPGSGSDPTYFQSRYYLINVTGGGANGASTRITAQVARIVPK